MIQIAKILGKGHENVSKISAKSTRIVENPRDCAQTKGTLIARRDARNN